MPKKPAALSEDLVKPVPPTPPMSAAEIEALFARFKEANPEPKGELQADNPFKLLVAVVLSAQATDVSVNRATRPLFETIDSDPYHRSLPHQGEERHRPVRHPGARPWR